MGALFALLNDKPVSEDRSVFVNQHAIIGFFHSSCPTIGTVPGPRTGFDAGKASAAPWEALAPGSARDIELYGLSGA